MVEKKNGEGGRMKWVKLAFLIFIFVVVGVMSSWGYLIYVSQMFSINYWTISLSMAFGNVVTLAFYIFYPKRKDG